MDQYAKIFVFPYYKQEGVNFDVEGTTKAFRGTITAVSADNLAAWSIGGFKALASAFRKCQYCMAVDEDIQTKVGCSTIFITNIQVINDTFKVCRK